MLHKRLLMTGFVAGILVFGGACSDDDDGGTPPASSPGSATATTQPSASATTDTGGGGSGRLDTTVVPNPSPLPTAEAPGDDWKTVTIPASERSERITFRYPADWTISSSADQPGAMPLTVVLYSPQGEKEPLQTLSKDSVKIDLYASPLSAQIGCDAQGTEPAKFGGLDGLRGVEKPASDGASEIERVESLYAEHGGFRYCLFALLAYSSGEQPTPEAMLSGFLSTLVIGN